MGAAPCRGLERSQQAGVARRGPAPGGAGPDCGGIVAVQ